MSRPQMEAVLSKEMGNACRREAVDKLAVTASRADWRSVFCMGDIVEDDRSERKKTTTLKNA